jgi:hypothetical protein
MKILVFFLFIFFIIIPNFSSYKILNEIYKLFPSNNYENFNLNDTSSFSEFSEFIIPLESFKDEEYLGSLNISYKDEFSIFNQNNNCSIKKYGPKNKLDVNDVTACKNVPSPIPLFYQYKEKRINSDNIKNFNQNNNMTANQNNYDYKSNQNINKPIDEESLVNFTLSQNSLIQEDALNMYSYPKNLFSNSEKKNRVPKLKIEMTEDKIIDSSPDEDLDLLKRKEKMIKKLGLINNINTSSGTNLYEDYDEAIYNISDD